jgi:hypothetical protein
LNNEIKSKDKDISEAKLERKTEGKKLREKIGKLKDKRDHNRKLINELKEDLQKYKDKLGKVQKKKKEFKEEHGKKCKQLEEQEKINTSISDSETMYKQQLEIYKNTIQTQHQTTSTISLLSFYLLNISLFTYLHIAQCVF